jgi:hypothetical protein
MKQKLQEIVALGPDAMPTPMNPLLARLFPGDTKEKAEIEAKHLKDLGEWNNYPNWFTKMLPGTYFAEATRMNAYPDALQLSKMFGS